jgi:chemotaxis response regulator CheB
MAANHIFGLGNPVPTATATLVAAVLVISAMTAQGQQPSADELKAHAQNAVKIISGEKQKIEAYCELADLTDQFDQAVEEKDAKKAEELSQKGEELLRKLGPEFAALTDGMKSVDLSSQDAREIGSIIGNLHEYCND